MPRNKKAKTPQLFDFEPEPPKQETPAPSFPKDADQFVDRVMYALTAPYMYFPPWDTIWEANDNKTKSVMYRLAHHKEIFEQQQCSEFEAMLYVSTATLAHPPGHDWFIIYAWLFRRWRPDQAAEIFDSHEGEELNVNQQEDLARLRRWIFNQQMAHLKAKRKAAARTRPAPKPAPKPQPSFF